METIVIKTGFSAIDVVTRGLKPSEVMVIAGQGRTGKTSLAISIAKNVAVIEEMLNPPDNDSLKIGEKKEDEEDQAEQKTSSAEQESEEDDGEEQQDENHQESIPMKNNRGMGVGKANSANIQRLEERFLQKIPQSLIELAHRIGRLGENGFHKEGKFLSHKDHGWGSAQ